MAIKKLENGKYRAIIQPGGRGHKKHQKTFKTKGEAKRWIIYMESTKLQKPDWEPEKRDFRKLKELVEIWFRHHGRTLKSGEDTKARLLLLCKRLGDPLAENLTADIFSVYRNERLNQGLTKNRVNREQHYLNGMFNKLIELNLWKKPNPIEKIKPFKIDENELSFLSNEEITELKKAIAESESHDLQIVCSICLATGARWSEAINLKKSQVRNGQIYFIGTKSGKNRAVPIPKELEQQIIKHKALSNEKLFTDCIKAFRNAIVKAKINLPRGQSSHVLRHTFASHFMMNGGNILTLQKILGHQSLEMTMRYSHLSPEHLEEARNLSPYNMVFSKED